MGTSRDDIRELSDEVKNVFGFALDQAQLGERHTDAKVLKGFGSAGVLEVVASDRGGTYRAVYTVRLKRPVYVLHVFQKKSKHGIETPKPDIEKIERRLKAAVEHHQEHYE